MKTHDDLKRILDRIDGMGYKAYRDIEGEYAFDDYILYIDHVQGDPFAPPSRIRVRAMQDKAGFPSDLYSKGTYIIACEDYINRLAERNIRAYAKGSRGTGKSGLIAIQRCGQEMFKRTAVVLTPTFIEMRLSIGLPAFGRRIAAKEAISMFFEQLPQIVKSTLYYRSVDNQQLYVWAHLYEDQEYIRHYLKAHGLVAFVADGSILPRESGVSDRPLKSNRVIKFRSPDSLRTTINLPNKGPISGMGIPAGITLIVGGGYHGKSTLLKAIERGVYNHIPGDGREYVVTVDDAVKIRAEDGRRVEKVDISAFISRLPDGQDTVGFSTDNASGSTSQAANIAEAIEIGTSLLLLDEDTCATNFMIRDSRMQRLVAKEHEPITPFIDRIKELHRQMGISTILVLGGSGDYLDVADRVIMMDAYVPHDVTEQARQVVAQTPNQRSVEAFKPISGVAERIPLKISLALNGRQKVKSKGVDIIQYGDMHLELDLVEQLVDPYQTAAIANIIRYAAQRYVDDRRTLGEIIDSVMEDIAQKGLDAVSPSFGRHPGEMAMPRKYEIAAAFNRLRSLTVKQQ